jgi:hypothetical protein
MNRLGGFFMTDAAAEKLEAFIAQVRVQMDAIRAAEKETAAQLQTKLATFIAKGMLKLLKHGVSVPEMQEKLRAIVDELEAEKQAQADAAPAEKEGESQ